MRLCPDRQGILPLLALLIFLNGSICFCDDHGAWEHRHSATLELEQGQNGPSEGREDHGPGDDECVQMDAAEMRQRGADDEAARQGSFPIDRIGREQGLSLDFVAGSKGGAEPPRIHAPPRFLAHCALLC